MSTLWPGALPGDPGPHSSNLYDITIGDDKEAVAASMPLQPAVKTGDGEVEENPRNIVAGSIWPGVNDTFYNRILIEPANLEMGNLLSNQTRVITVWNGFLVTKELQDFQRQNDAGISVTEPVAVPYDMRPLEQLQYILNISTDGPAVIAATYTWTVDGVDYSAAVTGRRVVIFPFGPTWSSPVTESLEWLTGIIRAYAGNEQRRQLRTRARRSFSYTLAITQRQDAARLENLLWGWQNRTYALPVWTDKSRSTREIARGDTEILVPTDTYSFSAGGMAVVYGNSKEMEVVEVDEVLADRITLKRPAEGDWRLGSIIMPMVLGHLPTSVPLMRYTNNKLIGTMTFACDPSNTDPYTPAGAAPTTYDSLEVLTRQPNWQAPLDNTFEYIFRTLDQNTGPIVWDQTEEFPRILRRYTWMHSDRQKIKAFRQMLGRLKGQFKSLYVPSWHEDFIVVGTLGAADTGIVVQDNEFRLMVGDDPARNHLMLRLEDGSVFYRKIVGVSSDGVNNILTVDAAFGRIITPSQVRALHVLSVSRLATDKVDIVWRSGRAATVDTTFTTVLE